MNCKHPLWHSSNTCRDGRVLYQDANDHGYEVTGPDTWTHYEEDGRGGNVLDIMIHKNVKASSELTVMPDLDSDHRPVLVQLTELPCRVALPPPRRKVDWIAFQSAAAERITTRPIQTTEDVESFTEELTMAIKTSIEDATTESPPAKKRDPLPAKIKALLREKRDTRTQWQQSRCPRTKARLNALIEQVRTALDDHAALLWEKHIDGMTEDVPSVHRLCRQLRSDPTPTQPLLGNDGMLRFVAADRAEILADSLERQFTPNEATDEAHTKMVEERVQEYLADRSDTTAEAQIFVSPSQVMKYIKLLPRRKAPGLDGIANEALRNLPPKTIVAMTRLFNGILRTCHFPSSWKKGKVVMLPKPGKDARKPESYRPITLLSTMSKLFERILLHYLTPHLTPREEQFGFRAEHSTTLQITRIVNEMAMCHNKKEYVVIVLLDMEKAFDRVWHSGLLYKLAASAATKSLIRVVASFLQNRSFVVSVEGTLSSEKPVRAGVPQGSCISPACYSWYTNDIPVVGQAKLALYADDAAYYASSYRPEYAVRRLQPTMEALPEWLAKWRMTVNVAKTQAMITGNTQLPTPLKLLEKDIPWKPSVKYLGVTIDRRLSFKTHTEEIVGRVRGARAKLLPVLRSRLPLKTKVMIYQLYLRPVLTYAAPAWYAHLTTTNRKKLQAQENVALRKIVNAPRYVRNNTIRKGWKMPNIESFVQELTTRMFQRADSSRLDHIAGIAPLHARPPEGTEKRKAKAYSRDLVRTE